MGNYGKNYFDLKNSSKIRLFDLWSTRNRLNNEQGLERRRLLLSKKTLQRRNISIEGGPEQMNKIPTTSTAKTITEQVTAAAATMITATTPTITII